MAQLAEQLICNQQVNGSSPVWVVYFISGVLAQLGEHLPYKQRVIGSSPIGPIMDGFPSGQRGQTVNLLHFASVVRIHLHPLRIFEVMNILNIL